MDCLDHVAFEFRCKSQFINCFINAYLPILHDESALNPIAADVFAVSKSRLCCSTANGIIRL